MVCADLDADAAGIFVPPGRDGRIPDDKWDLTYAINVTGFYLAADDARFLAPGRDMPERVRAYCRETDQTPPEGPGAITRCVLESLALADARTLATIDRVAERTTDTVHIVGGGSRNALLSQWTADASGREVVCGPAEATLLGNPLVQASALGATDIGEIRDHVRASSDLVVYEPDAAGWDEPRQRFEALVAG